MHDDAYRSWVTLSGCDDDDDDDDDGDHEAEHDDEPQKRIVKPLHNSLTTTTLSMTPSLYDGASSNDQGRVSGDVSRGSQSASLSQYAWFYCGQDHFWVCGGSIRASSCCPC